MDIVDLRIGNYVEYNGMSAVVAGLLSPKPRKPESFNSVPVVELFCGGLINALLPEINPIKITEEILLRFGFKNEIDDIDGEMYDIYFVTNTDYLIEYFHSDKKYVFTDDMGLKVGIKYLHQLQNLFYCLCGFELEVKL